MPAFQFMPEGMQLTPPADAPRAFRDETPEHAPAPSGDAGLMALIRQIMGAREQEETMQPPQAEPMPIRTTSTQTRSIPSRL
jgi:hypothetical protein